MMALLHYLEEIFGKLWQEQHNQSFEQIKTTKSVSTVICLWKAFSASLYARQQMP